MDKKKAILLALVLIIIGYLIADEYLLHRKFHNGKELILYGNVDIRQVDLGFRVSGRLEAMHFEEGDRVEKGTFLAELDNKPYNENVRQIQGRASALQSSLDYAEIQFRKREALISSQSISDEEYQQVFYNHKTLQSNLEEADAALANAKIQLEDTKLLSPSDGIILTRIREPGTILKAGDPVFILSLPSPLWIRAYISEVYLGKVYSGMQAEIYTDTPSSPVYEGRVGFISSVAEFTPKSVESSELRTDLVYQIRVVVDNPDKRLLQGMPVTIKLKMDKNGNERDPRRKSDQVF